MHHYPALSVAIESALGLEVHLGAGTSHHVLVVDDELFEGQTKRLEVESGSHRGQIR